MTAALITPPAVEPVALADAKAHLRIDSGDDDALLTAALVAARVHVEALTRRVLIEQGWRVYRDAWPPDRSLTIRLAPLISVDAVTIYDADGDPTVLAEDAYAGDAISVPGRIVLAASAPPPGRAVNGI
jgi:uncharacterized phiE125 gp8 family phage protein